MVKLFEVEVDSTDEDEEKVNQIVYSLVDLITQLEEDGKVFKITIEKIDSETIESPNRYLH
jgi:hypothetical protein